MPRSKGSAEQLRNGVEAAFDDAVVEVIVQEIPINAISQKAREPVEGLLDQREINFIPIKIRAFANRKSGREAPPSSNRSRLPLPNPIAFVYAVGN